MKDFSAPGAVILLLDSDPVTRSVLHDALRDSGYLVVSAADLGAAIDRLHEIQPDLLVIRPWVDCMPGHIAADNLRSRHSGLPVLMVDGFMDDDRIRDRNAIEGFHTFPPPYPRADLLRKVDEVLRHAHKHK